MCQLTTIITEGGSNPVSLCDQLAPALADGGWKVLETADTAKGRLGGSKG